MGYSVVIRTIGDSPFLENELREIYSQSVKPEKVRIYLPEGGHAPGCKVADEEYLFVRKGMMHQRLLPYDDISSDYILMLDDDVSLEYDSVEKLIRIAEKYDADLLGVDTFKNHQLPFSLKVKAAVTNLVVPHFSKKWAFKIHKNGSFSYNNNPRRNYYISQSCAGNAMLWKTDTYKNLNISDELWLETLRYTYSEDMLQSYKVYKNGMKLGVVFNSGIRHLDFKSASASYQADPQKIKIRTIAQFAIWWRTCYKPGHTGSISKFLSACSFSFKMAWLFVLFLSLSLVKFDFSYCSNFLKGISEGWKFVHSKPFRSLRPYVIQ